MGVEELCPLSWPSLARNGKNKDSKNGMIWNIMKLVQLQRKFWRESWSDPITVMLMEASWRIPGSSKTHLQDWWLNQYTVLVTLDHNPESFHTYLSKTSYEESMMQSFLPIHSLLAIFSDAIFLGGSACSSSCAHITGILPPKLVVAHLGSYPTY